MAFNIIFLQPIARIQVALATDFVWKAAASAEKAGEEQVATKWTTKLDNVYQTAQVMVNSI